MNRFASVAVLLLSFSFSAFAARPDVRARSSKVSGSEEGHFSFAPLVGGGFGFASPESVTFRNASRIGAVTLRSGDTINPRTGDPYYLPKPYGFNLGIRGGYTFPFHLYLGSLLTFDLGSSSDIESEVRNPFGVSAKMFTALGEVGWQFEWDMVRLRPFVGFGIADVMFSTYKVRANNVSANNVPLRDDSTSSVGFALTPGMVFEFSFSGSSPGPFIGLDTHLSIVTESSAIGMVFFASGGYRF